MTKKQNYSDFTTKQTILKKKKRKQPIILFQLYEIGKRLVT